MGVAECRIYRQALTTRKLVRLTHHCCRATSRLVFTVESVWGNPSSKVPEFRSYVQIHMCASLVCPSVLRASTPLILQRPLDNLRQMLPPILTRDIPNPRRQIQHSSLRNRPIHELRHVRLRVPDRLEPARDAQAVEEPRDGLEEVRADVGVGDRRDGRVGGGGAAEDGEGFAVPGGRGGGGELEDGGGSERDAA